MTRDEIIAANPIQEFVRNRGHELKRSGKNFVTNASPLTQHKPGHRPVMIYPENNSWYDHDLKTGGSVIDWVMHEKNLSADDAMRELGGGRNGQAEPKRLIAASYSYTDESGTELFQCVRFLPKGFAQRHPDSNGNWIWNLKGVRRVLYRLPEITKDIRQGLPVFICEGEKDVLALVEHGLAATCNPMGAGKWRDSYSETLRGADVTIIADKDEDGRKHAQLVASKIHGISKFVRLLELPDVKQKSVKDAADYFEAGGDTDKLIALADKTPEWTPIPAASTDLQESIAAAANEEARHCVLIDPRTITPKAVKWIERPYLARGEFHLIHGEGGAYKSTMLILWAAETSQRGEMALLIMAEDDHASKIVPALIAAQADMQFVRIVNMQQGDNQDAVSLPGDVPKLQSQIIEVQAKFVGIDPVMTHIATYLNSHKDHDVKRALTPLVTTARKTGAAIVSAHHTGKDTSRGAKLSGMASIAFYTTPRIVMAMAEYEKTNAVLEVVKSNIGPTHDKMLLKADFPEIQPGINPPRLTRSGESDVGVEDIWNKERKEEISKTRQAAILMLNILEEANGEAVKQIDLFKQVSDQLDMSPQTVRRNAYYGKGMLHDLELVKSYKDGFQGEWFINRSDVPRPPHLAKSDAKSDPKSDAKSDDLLNTTL